MMMQFDHNFKGGSRRENTEVCLVVLKAKKIVQNTSHANTYLLCQVGNAIVPNVRLVGPTRWVAPPVWSLDIISCLHLHPIIKI